MICLDRKREIEHISGTAEEILTELGHISSSIEEMLAEKVGVEAAEKLVDDAIRGGREYNRKYVFGWGGTGSPCSVEEEM